MCDLKQNQKSIRLSDKVMKYIEDYPGDSFNQKLNDIVIYFMEIEEKKVEKIKFYDEVIHSKKEEYHKLCNDYYKYHDLVKEISGFGNYYDELINKIEELAGD